MNLSDYNANPSQFTADQLSELAGLLQDLRAAKRFLELYPRVTFVGSPHMEVSPGLLELIADQTHTFTYQEAQTLLIFADCVLTCPRVKNKVDNGANFPTSIISNGLKPIATQ